MDYDISVFCDEAVKPTVTKDGRRSRPYVVTLTNGESKLGIILHMSAESFQTFRKTMLKEITAVE